LIVQAFLFSRSSTSISQEKLESYDKQDQNEEDLDFMDQQTQRDRFRIMKSLDKLHNIVVHIRDSASRTTEFVQTAKVRISLNNRTR
jgi:hypothetical protein